MKRRLLTSFLLVTLLTSLFPVQIGTAAPAPFAPAKPDPRQPDSVVIYQATPDGKLKKIETNMPLIHRANISPTGRFVYGERIGYAKADPTIPFLYDMQTKKLTQLSGFAKWSPKQDVLYIRENGGIVRLTLADGKKTVLVPTVAQYPVLDFSVSTDEQYIAFTRKDEKSSDAKGSAHLYLQHLPTFQVKMNDQYAWKQDLFGPEEKFYWTPNSKKLFYQTQTVYKELDLPTGLTYEHKMTAFPSYSSDMRYRYMNTGQEQYVLDLQTGKKIVLKMNGFPPYLKKIIWSPIGHQFAAEELFMGAASSRDAYMLLFFFKEPTKFSHPFGDQVDSKMLGTYLDAFDNFRLIGWAKDGKSYYFADLASTHFTHYSTDKADEEFRLYEQR
ncbi:hypothetical protein [Brevibacillus sp. NRS-1366]|uniref:hypothetical protein n=1 Tax=Brevibacillus sp. NRS-1366 TaxID=3233899 RepID=UPI003D1DB92A